MFGLGPSELIIIAVIVLLIFGAKRLPEIGKGLGSAIREFKDVKKEISSKESPDQDQDKEDENQTPRRDDNPGSLESKVMDKALDQVPGMRKAKQLKDKAKRIKEIIE